MNALREKTLAIVDVETTGASPTGDRIIEIGILRVEEGRVVETFQTLINPEKYVPPSIEEITGIKAVDLLTAPTFEDIYQEVGRLLEGAIFVAHNARFDYGFIKNEFKRHGISYNAKCLCTVRLSRKLYPTHKRHDLSTLIERFGFTCEHRHRAFDDAEVLWHFLQQESKLRSVEELDEIFKKIMKENTLPQFLDEKTLKSLPEGPGVYIFYGPEDEILYIGKSRNIRHRVLSHFSNDHSTSKEMHLCQETRRVDALTCAGELSALLLESNLIKRHSPLYNRQLRRRAELAVIKKGMSQSYTTAIVERARGINPDEASQVLAVFRNVRQAKNFLTEAAREHGLCPKLLGLEKSTGACFAHQIGRCRGACVEKVEPETYNKQIAEVFKARRLRAWPFAGPIKIEETQDDSERHIFILDNWCLLKDAIIGDYESEVHEHSGRFDYDAYKIFLRYLKDPTNKKRIELLSPLELKKLLNAEERVVEFDPSI